MIVGYSLLNGSKDHTLSVCLLGSIVGLMGMIAILLKPEQHIAEGKNPMKPTNPSKWLLIHTDSTGITRKMIGRRVGEGFGEVRIWTNV